MNIIQEAKDKLKIINIGIEIAEDGAKKEGQDLARIIQGLVDRLECDKLPIVQLDKYYPKLKNEFYVKLFISNEDFDKIEKVANGFMVPILALNPLPPVGDK